MPIPLPPKLLCHHPSGSTHIVLLTRNATLLERHLYPAAPDEQTATVLGQVVQNPADPHVFGLRSLTAAPWSATFADGTMQEGPPPRAVPTLGRGGMG